MSQIEFFNTPPEYAFAHVTAPPLAAVTWTMLEAAYNLYKDYQLLHRFMLQDVSNNNKNHNIASKLR